MKVAIYCRVSTDKQELEQQIDTCKKFCDMKGWDDIEVFTEIQSSIKHRPIFINLLKEARRGAFDCIVVFRLDRAWRKSRDFIMDYDSLESRGVKVVSVMEGLDPSTPIGKAMMTILVALAELERTNISIATKQRLQAKKNLGQKLGRPKGSKDKCKRKKGGYYGNINSAKKGGLKKRVEL